MSKRVRVVIPEAPESVVIATHARRKKRPGGLRLGVLDNGKANAGHLLKFLVERISALVPVAAVVSLRKEIVSRPAPGEILDRLTLDADFVVSAMAD